MPSKVPRFDSLDVKILEVLGIYGPRNINQIARKIGVSHQTIRFRMNRMSSFFRLGMHAAVYHTNLGLKKAVVFAEAMPGKEDLLFQCLKINSFYVYLSRCYGPFEGCFAIYTVPIDHYSEIIEFIQELQKLGVAKNTRLYPSTCFHTVNHTSRWFDSDSQKWIFPWDEWIKEIPTQTTSLPYTLVEPKTWKLKADEMDLSILQELEVNATISLAKIAKIWKTTPQNVKYHYEQHIIKQGLLEKYQITIWPFSKKSSIVLWFLFKFETSGKMAKFASSLLDKPFANGLGKILNENALVAQIYLPISEFRHFLDCLTQLYKDGILKSYEFIIQDSRRERWSRETIPFEDFKDGKWIYNHNKHIKDVRRLVKQHRHSEPQHN